jgi:hypothetical protein
MRAVRVESLEMSLNECESYRGLGGHWYPHLPFEGIGDDGDG